MPNKAERGYSCSGVKSVVIENGVTSIGQKAFYWCYKLTSITISKNMTTIGESALANCDSLIYIYLPKTLKTVGTNAFEECDGLSAVYYSGTSSTWKNVTVNDGNGCLTSAKFYYGTTEKFTATISNGVLTITGKGAI